MSGALVLTLEECVRLNNSLLKAVKSADVGTLQDILGQLKGCEVRGKLKARARAGSRRAPIVLCAGRKRS